MDFFEIANPWSIYSLPDGRKMRVRHVLVDVMKTGDDSDSNPVYAMNFQLVAYIEPEDLASKSAKFGVSAKSLTKGSTVQ